MSAVRLIHAVVPAMQKKGWGRIIAITSTSVKSPIGTLLLSNTQNRAHRLFKNHCNGTGPGWHYSECHFAGYS